MSFEDFANALAYSFVREIGGEEICTAKLNNFPPHRLIAGENSSLLVVKGDGLTREQVNSETSDLLKMVSGRQLHSRLNILTVIYVFEAECPRDLQRSIPRIAKRPMFSIGNSGIYGGCVDLSAGKATVSADLLVANTGTVVRKALKDYRDGRLTLDREVCSEAIKEESGLHRDFEARLSRTVPWATYLIASLCILMFILESLAGGSEDSMVLLRLGAGSAPLVRQGEWWRFVGATFLHIGIVHLIMNMYALVLVGTVLERYLGNIKFLALYAFAGIAGSAASASMGVVLGAGASGAIFGLFGAAAFVGYRYRSEIPLKFRNRLAGGMAVNIIYNLIYGFSQQGIDNSAHIGGLLLGVLFAAVVPPDITDKKGWFSTKQAMAVFSMFAFAPFAVEAFVVSRAVTFKGPQAYPLRELRNQNFHYTIRYPAFLKHEENEHGDALIFPGMSFLVSSFEEKENIVVDESTREELLKEFKGSADLNISKNSIEILDGRKWLLIQGGGKVKEQNLNFQTSLLGQGRRGYIIYMYSTRENLQDADKIQRTLMDNFNPE